MSTEIPGPVFALDVRTGPDAGVVRLRLTDEHGRQLGAHQVRLAEHKAALWQGLFDTRSFVRTYANSMRFTGRPDRPPALARPLAPPSGPPAAAPDRLKGRPALASLQIPRGRQCSRAGCRSVASTKDNTSR